jgi:hypothetical protein
MSCYRQPNSLHPDIQSAAQSGQLDHEPGELLMSFKSTLAATSLALAALISAGAAHAQVNCNAAPNSVSRANCQRAMIDMYQQGASNQAAMERDLANRARAVEQAQSYGSYAAGRHRDPRVGAAFDGGVAAGGIASELALRNQRVRNWNDRLWGQ